MKNKGFTLVELLAVIVIISIISVIAVPNVINVLNTSKETISDEQKLAIENAARAWGLKNVSLSDNNKPKKSFVTIDELYQKKYIGNKVLSNLNLSRSDLVNAGVCISWNSNYNQFVYKYDDNVANCEEATEENIEEAEEESASEERAW